MKVVRETDLVKQLLQWLKLRGIDAWRQNAGAMAGEYKGKRRFLRFAGVEGISDIIGLVSVNVMPLPFGTQAGPMTIARFLAIEAKMPGNKPTEKQIAFLEMVRRAGGIGLVVYSLADLESGLRDEGVIR